MTFATKKGIIGRKPITIVELHLDTCANSFGVSPCTASAATGGECYNTFKTCQDTPNYNKSTKIYRFCDVANVPDGLEAFPFLNSVDLAPTELNLTGLGKRASITCSFFDAPHHDRGIDPYVSTRTYDTEQGTFFGKLRARNPHYQGRKLVVRTGYIGDPFDTTLAADFEVRTFFIDTFSDVDSNGNVRIVARDILKFADDDKTEVPPATDAELADDLTISSTEIPLTAGYSVTFPSSGVVRINDEIMSYSSKTGDILEGVVRAQYSTIASNHGEEDAVQLCKVFDDERCIDIMQELLEDYAGIDSSYLDFSNWETEFDEKRTQYNFSSVIAEPTGVKDLLEEILQSSASYMWWEPVSQKIKWVPLFHVKESASFGTITDDDIINRSMRVETRDKDRLTRNIVYFNQLNPVDDIKKTNFKQVNAFVNTDAESANSFDIIREEVVLSRWIPTGAVAKDVNERFISLRVDGPRRVRFRLDAKDSALEVGDIFDLTSRMVQSVTGQDDGGLFLVIKKNEIERGSTIEYNAYEYNLTASFGVYAPDSQVDFSSANDTEKDTYVFYSDDDGLMSDGTEGYNYI